MTNQSITTPNQSTKYGPREFVEDGQAYRIYANVRYDDECGNGHNTFAITGEIFRLQINRGGRSSFDSCGCLHDDIAKHFPELAPFLKWHLMSSDGPMHYVANTIYHASEYPDGHILAKGADLEAARRSAIWPDATLDQLKDEAALLERLPDLINDFRSDVLSLGFDW